MKYIGKVYRVSWAQRDERDRVIAIETPRVELVGEYVDPYEAARAVKRHIRTHQCSIHDYGTVEDEKGIRYRSFIVSLVETCRREPDEDGPGDGDAWSGGFAKNH